MPKLVNRVNVYDDGSVKVIPVTTTPEPEPPVDLFRVRKWGDEVMVREYGKDYALVGSNFQVVQLYVPGAGTWSAITNYVTLGRSEMNYLMALQRDYGSGPAGVDSFNQRMNWLVYEGVGTRPYWYGKWKTATEFRYGTMLWGGQLVRIDGEETFVTSTPNNSKKRSIRMGKVVMFTKADFAAALDGKVTPEKNPEVIPQCAAVGSGNKYVTTPKGFTMFSPIWGGEWGRTLPTRDFYIPLECLESV